MPLNIINAFHIFPFFSQNLVLSPYVQKNMVPVVYVSASKCYNRLSGG